MYSSQFDTTNAFSGGGFTSSQSTQSADFGVSPAKSRETQGLVPVTVKQISEAFNSADERSNLPINGNVTLVGMMFNKAERVTDVGFTLDDGTGRIDCKRWLNEAFDKKEIEEIHDGLYVRVNGHLKNFQGMRQLAAFSVRPVINFDEITFHFIDCIHTHLLKSKLRGDGPTQPQMVDSSLSTPVRNGSTGHQVAPNQFSSQFSVDGLKGCDQLVLEFLQQPSNFEQEKGIHRDELSQKLKLPVEKIMESIRSLEEEGLIYSTIDEFHFKSTASG